MDQENKKRVYDVTGHMILTDAIQGMLDQTAGEHVAFSELDEFGGLAWFPLSSAFVESVKAGTYESGDILGHVDATCLYPFAIVCRTATKNKTEIKAKLDAIGEALEKMEYPALTDTRSILSVRRDTPAYLDATNEDSMEDWAIKLTLRYRDEFER